MLTPIASLSLNGIFLNFINSILLSREFLSVIIIFDTETDYLATGIISCDQTLQHNWYAINVDTNKNKNFEQFRKQNYTNAMVISVFRSYRLQRKIKNSIVFIYPQFREYTSHLIITTGRILNDEQSLIAVLDFNSVLVIMSNSTIEVLQINARQNNLFTPSNISNADGLLYKRIFYDKSLNMYGRRLAIHAGLQYPPRLINIIKQCKHKKTPNSVCFVRAIGGCDGFIASILGKYFNATVLAYTLQLSIIAGRSSQFGKFLQFYRFLDKTYIVEDVDSIIVVNG